ncbi:MAG: hypothetical protein ACI8W8_000746 [Rhodothermales bacterium]|jgi:hypothetical protein
MSRADELLAELQAEAAALRRNTRIALSVYGVLITLSILSTTYTAAQLRAETAPELAAEQAAAIIGHFATEARVELIRDVRKRSADWPEKLAVASREGVVKVNAKANAQIASFVEAAVAPQLATLNPLELADSAATVDIIFASVYFQAGAIIRDAISADPEQSAIESARRKIAIYWLLSNDGERATVPALVLERMADGMAKLLAKPVGESPSQ